MLRRVVRTVLFAIVTVAIWTVARPATAMPAPFCDDRGATAMAPDPLLEAPDVAVHRWPARATAATCETDDAFAGAAIAPGQGQPATPSPQADQAIPLPAAVLGPPAPLLRRFPTDATPVSDGVRFKVERPPRG